jgi:putative MATE family efflux protein
MQNNIHNSNDNNKQTYVQKIKYYYQKIREAIRGQDFDYTEIPLKKAMWLLAVPMVLEMIMESVFAIVDIFFVSKLGADAIATVGITESLMTLVYALGFGLATATTAMVSRRIGEKEPQKAASIGFQAILTGFFVSMAIAIPGVIYTKDILKLMGTNDNIVNNLHSFTAIMLGSNLVIMWLFIINAIFRSAGNAVIAMRVLFLANCINIVLDPILIFGLGPIPAMGVTGAAIATTTGRGIAVIYQIYLLFSGKSIIHFRLKLLRPEFPVIGSLIKLSLGSIGQNLIATSSWIGLMRIISIFGSEVLAAYTIAIRLIIFSLLPSWGLSNAAATLVGQNLGAGKPDRAERAVWAAGKATMVLLGMVSLFFILYPEIFIRIFTNDIAIIAQGIVALRIISIGFIFYGLGMVMMNAINGAGDTVTPTKINFLCFWMIEIPLAWFLAISLKMEQQGVFIAIVIAESLLALIAGWWFRKGKWKLMEV